MTNDQFSELIDALARRHQVKIRQLTDLVERDGGFEILDLASKVLGDVISAADWLTSGQISISLFE